MKQLTMFIFALSLSFPLAGWTEANSRNTTTTNKVTPMDQAKGSAADVETTRKIREEIVKNKELSTSAHNVKIVTLGGKVTLRGEVKNQTESTYIKDVAEKFAGKGFVMNELEIARTY